MATCKYCKKPVLLFMTRSKSWQSLQPTPEPYRFDGDETPEGWAILFTPQRTVYVIPARDLPVRRLREMTRLYTAHYCAEAAQARYDRRMQRGFEISADEFAAALGGEEPPPRRPPYRRR